MRTAYKVRAYPDAEQAALLRRTFGCVRLVWNKTLAERQQRYTTEQKSTSYKATDAALSEWKKTEDLAFLSEVSSVPLQQTLRHQHSAFAAFFKGLARYPRFKSRHDAYWTDGGRRHRFARSARGARGRSFMVTASRNATQATRNVPQMTAVMMMAVKLSPYLRRECTCGPTRRV